MAPRVDTDGNLLLDTAAVHPTWLEADQLLRECESRRVRRSGPGGQHRNKVETGIVLRHRPTGLSAEAGERRSQPENLRTALTRLRLRLALEVRRDLPPESAPSALWQSRCQAGRIVVNPRHADFPSLLAEALDTLRAAEGDVATAAGRLGCTPTQLTRFLKHEPRALDRVNAWRAARGLHRLK